MEGRDLLVREMRRRGPLLSILGIRKLFLFSRRVVRSIDETRENLSSCPRKKRKNKRIDDLFDFYPSVCKDRLHGALLRFSKKKERDCPREKKDTDKASFPYRNRARLFQSGSPLSSHSKELFNERNLCRVSFDTPVRRFLLVRDVCSFFLDHRNPYRDSNGGSMGKSYCQVKDIFDTLKLSSYHSLLLHLFHFENRLDEIPSVNIISIRNYYIYVYKCLIP